MGFVYRITNRANGRCYVGQTVRTVARRWKSHVSESHDGKHDTALNRAIRKYGSESFTIDTLGEYEDDELNEAEVSWIRKLDTLAPNGYNLLEGGKQGGRMSENLYAEHVERMRKPSTIEKCRIAATGQVRTNEQRNFLRELNGVTEESVLEMFRLREIGLSYVDIGIRVGVSKTTVRNYLTGRKSL